MATDILPAIWMEETIRGVVKEELVTEQLAFSDGVKDMVQAAVAAAKTDLRNSIMKDIEGAIEDGGMVTFPVEGRGVRMQSMTLRNTLRKAYKQASRNKVRWQRSMPPRVCTSLTVCTDRQELLRKIERKLELIGGDVHELSWNAQCHDNFIDELQTYVQHHQELHVSTRQSLFQLPLEMRTYVNEKLLTPSVTDVTDDVRLSRMEARIDRMEDGIRSLAVSVGRMMQERDLLCDELFE